MQFDAIDRSVFADVRKSRCTHAKNEFLSIVQTKRGRRDAELKLGIIESINKQSHNVSIDYIPANAVWQNIDLLFLFQNWKYTVSLRQYPVLYTVAYLNRSLKL